MKITFLGHAAVSLEVDGVTVLVDPFITGNGFAEAAGIRADALSADVILLTHAHGDHFGDTPGIAKRTGALVVAQHEIAEYMSREHGYAKVHGINIGGVLGLRMGQCHADLCAAFVVLS